MVVNLVCVAGGFQRGARLEREEQPRGEWGKSARSATILFHAFKSRGRREEMQVGKITRGWGRG